MSAAPEEILASIDAIRRGAASVLGALARENTVIGDEVVEKAYGQAILRRSSFRQEADLETWLFSIGRNTARSYGRVFARHKGVRPSLDETDPMPVLESLGDHSSDGLPESAAMQRAQLKAIMDCLASLQTTNPDWVAVFKLYLIGIEMRVISKLLGVPLGTVKSSISRVRSHLRKKLAASGMFDEHL